MENTVAKQNNDRKGPADDWVKSSRLFSHWKAMKEQILLHKWYESEKAGRDIGWEKAAANWMIHHRQGFRSSYSDSGNS